MLRVHDSEILSYNVDLIKQKINIHIENSDSTSVLKSNIIFTDVFVHSFENQLKGSIIFDIEEFEVTQFIEDNKELLKKQKNYCWPMDYNTLEELLDKMLKEKYSYYKISASYGLSGWVLSKSYEIVQVE